MYRKNKPHNIPSNPSCVYKEQWIGFPDWLGYTRNKCDPLKYKINSSFFKTWTLDMAYIFGFWFSDGHIKTEVASQKTKSCYNFVCSPNESRLLRDFMYATNSKLFLTRKKEKFIIMIKIKLSPCQKSKLFVTYECAKAIVNNMSIKNQRDFYARIKSGNKYNIPSQPQLTYRGKGWVNWYDFLGKRQGVQNESLD